MQVLTGHLLLMAINRLIGVCLPTVFAMVFTPGATKVYTLLAWLWGSAYAGLRLFICCPLSYSHDGFASVNGCLFRNFWCTLYFLIFLELISVLPIHTDANGTVFVDPLDYLTGMAPYDMWLTIIGATPTALIYVVVAVRLLGLAYKGATSHHNETNHQYGGASIDTRLSLQFFLILFFFLLMSFIWLYGQSVPVLAQVLPFVQCLNSYINPMIYLVFNRTIRMAVADVLRINLSNTNRVIAAASSNSTGGTKLLQHGNGNGGRSDAPATVSQQSHSHM